MLPFAALVAVTTTTTTTTTTTSPNVAGEERGPAIELPETPERTGLKSRVEAETSTAAGSGIALGTGKLPDYVLVRGLQEERLSGHGTVLGSYGEFNLTYLSVGASAPFVGTATVRRLVLFVAHNFSESFRGYVELEAENAIACSRCAGSFEVEQGFVEWSLGRWDLRLRGGLILVPFGIINQWHEPTVFHGVERPRVDQLIVPTTWRELGVGAAFSPFEGGRVELYAMTAPDALLLGPTGITGARTLGSLAPANSWMVSGRFEVEPLLGFVLGASGLGADLGGGNRLFTADGRDANLTLPLLGVGLDARWRRSGLEARVFGALFSMPRSGDLMEARRKDGGRFFPAGSSAVPTRLLGGYAEVAYDVLRLLFTTEQQLLPFVRLEAYDNHSRVPAGQVRDPLLQVVEWTFGLSYRPIQQVVVKADYQLRDRHRGLDEQQLDFGLGYVF